MLSIKELQSIVENTIGNLQLVKPPQNLYKPIEYTMSLGGKRIRPVMCLAACQLYSGDYTNALSAAMGIELFHNFTLLHDDVMDNADVRRNHPTVHKKWDVNTAILSGDAMLIESLIKVAETPQAYLKQVLDVFNKTSLEVCEGQQYDMEFEALEMVSEDDYLEMIRLKTAVLLAGGMKIGAIIGGATTVQADMIYSFAINIGLAFQLQDDMLDIYGDQKDFGKAIGGDIVANKKTLPMINAWYLANEEQRTQLKHWLTIENFERAEKIEAVTNIYNQLDVKGIVNQKINDYFAKAMQCLDTLEIDTVGKQQLEEFATMLISRKR